MDKKIENLESLGIFLSNITESQKKKVFEKNNWFTKENIDYSIDYWRNILNKSNLIEWISNYNFATKNKILGIISAGNLPFVGLHDVLCGYISNYDLKIKLSSSDDILMKIAIDFLKENSLGKNIQIVENIKDVDSIIATGSNNTFRYFDYYFSQIPNILRKSRTSVAVLDGEESKEDLKKMADDFFVYYGLGCRNLSKIYIPKGYDIDRIFEAFYHYKGIQNHNKYRNNYDYNRAIYILEKIYFRENGFFMMRESEVFQSPLSVLHYEYYYDIENVKKDIEYNRDHIQCVISNNNGLLIENVKFGESQKPKLSTYSDNIDIMTFLK